MLTLYHPPRKAKETEKESESSESSEAEDIIPAGRPYLTKINGRLVMARQKTDRPAHVAVDLLGESLGLGIRSRVVQKRTASLAGEPPKSMITAIPPQNQIAWTTPIPQQNFFPPPSMQMPFARSPFLPYQPFFQPPPVPSQQLVPPVAYNVPPRKPTKEDFELLRRIDADYNSKNSGQSHARTSSAPPLIDGRDSNSGLPRTTITITKHICVNCRMVRSRQYHRENPIKTGEAPKPALCGRCQREASSTDVSSSPRAKTKMDMSKNKKLQKKTKASAKSSGDDSPMSPTQEKPKKKSESKKMQNRAKRSSSEESDRDRNHRHENRAELQHRNGSDRPGRSYRPTDLSILDKNSEEETEQRGRQRLRYDGSDVARRPLSNLATQSYVRQSYPDGHYDNLRQQGRRYRPRGNHEPLDEESPSRHHRETRQLPRRQRLGLPEHRNERRGSRLLKDDETARSNGSLHGRDGNFDSVPKRGMPSREDSFESFYSAFSHESSQRRRNERSYPSKEPSKPWEAPHVIHPRPADEEIVVTERFVYRPKRNKEDQNIRRRRKPGDATGSKYDMRSRIDISEVDHAYYNENWAGEVTSRDGSVRGRTAAQRRGYRRDKYRDSELYSETSKDDSSEYRRAYDAVHENIPQAPTPLSALSLSSSPSSSSPSAESYQAPPPYPLSSDSETFHKLDIARKEKVAQNLQLPPPPPLSRTRSRSRSRSISSTYRPPSVREAADGVSEKALVPTPARRSHSRSADVRNEQALIATPRIPSASPRRASRSRSRSRGGRVREYTVVDASDLAKMETEAERRVRFSDDDDDDPGGYGGGYGYDWGGNHRGGAMWGESSGGGGEQHMGSERGPCNNWGDC